MAIALAVGVMIIGEAQAQPKKPLTAAEKTQKLAQWRAAFDCATFHANRMDRFEKQRDEAAARQAEELWMDWDDLAIEIEEELDLPLHEEAELSRKVEATHQAQLAKSGWPGYDKAWMGKCGKSPY